MLKQNWTLHIASKLGGGDDDDDGDIEGVEPSEAQAYMDSLAAVGCTL